MSSFLFKKEVRSEALPRALAVEAGFHPSVMPKAKERATESHGRVFGRRAVYGRKMEMKSKALVEVRCNRCDAHIGYTKIVCFFGNEISYVKTMRNADFYCEMICDRCRSTLKDGE